MLTDAADARAAEQIARERSRIEAGAKTAIEKMQRESVEALQNLRGEIAEREAVAREVGKREADCTLQQKLAAAEKAKAEVEVTTQQRIAALERASHERETEWQGKIATAERGKQEALEHCESLKASQEEVVSERVKEVREAMEKDKASALGTERAKHFDETQKLIAKLETVTRQLDRKTAEELGEGAEINLFEALKAEFDGDRIERVRKGVSGADIIHTVMHNNRDCGRIIYDSKNSTVWRNDYVSKLVQDQTAARADHAILSTFKLQDGVRQVEMRGTVIVVNPARALALVQIIRKHMVQLHTLRLSRSERATKMAALYDFITSERCGHLLAQIESGADALLQLQEEAKAHQVHWKQEGRCYALSRVKNELEIEIDQIIGTDDGARMIR